MAMALTGCHMIRAASDYLPTFWHANTASFPTSILSRSTHVFNSSATPSYILFHHSHIFVRFIVHLARHHNIPFVSPFVCLPLDSASTYLCLDHLFLNAAPLCLSLSLSICLHSDRAYQPVCPYPIPSLQHSNPYTSPLCSSHPCQAHSRWQQKHNRLQHVSYA